MCTEYEKQVYAILASLNSDLSLTEWSARAKRLAAVAKVMGVEDWREVFGGSPMRFRESELAWYGELQRVNGRVRLTKKGLADLREYFQPSVEARYGKRVAVDDRQSGVVVSS